jgi:hypothetical protein
MATPIKHPDENKVFLAPPGMADCLDLSVCMTEAGIESVWELDDTEVWDLLKTKKLLLLVVTRSAPPPVWVGVIRPESIKPITAKEWYANHRYCPACGSELSQETTIGVLALPGVPFQDLANQGTCTKKHKRYLHEFTAQPKAVFSQRSDRADGRPEGSSASER